MLAANLGGIQEADGATGTFGGCPAQAALPNTHEVAGGLDDISFIATDNGAQIEQD